MLYVFRNLAKTHNFKTCFSFESKFYLKFSIGKVSLVFQNLYGYAMSEKVPIDEIDFVDERTVAEWTTQDIIDMDASGDQSYIFEVDIEIPEEIHDQTSDYPLCPEKLEITKDMVSPKSW